MTVSINGYNGTVTAGGVDGEKITGGLTMAGGDGSKPLALSVAKGAESEVIPFAIRLASDVIPPPVSLNLTSDSTTDYLVTASSIFAPGKEGYKAFNGNLDDRWSSNYPTGLLKIHKNTGLFKLLGYVVYSGMYSEYSPTTILVKNAEGIEVDKRSVTWVNSESKTFMFNKQVNTNELTFEVSTSAQPVALWDVKFIYAEELPTTSKITVSAEGENSADWAFGKNIVSSNIANMCTVSSSGKVCTTNGVAMDATTQKFLTDGNMENVIQMLNYSGSIIFTMQSITSVSRVVIKTGRYDVALQPVLKILADDTIMQELKNVIVTPGGSWEIPINKSCKTITVTSNTNVNNIGEVEIWTTDGIVFNNYGDPLVVNAPLIDKNMIFYAKCKSIASDVIGNDTTTKIKIVVE